MSGSKIRWITLWVVLVILVAVLLPIASADSPAITASPTPTPNQPEAAARQWMNEWLVSFKTQGDFSEKLDAFEINTVTLIAAEGNEHEFSILFSVKPAADAASIWLADNGVYENGWIRDKRLFITLIQENGNYRLDRMGILPELASLELPLCQLTPLTVTLYFRHTQNTSGCDVVFPVERLIYAGPDRADAALKALFAGPTPEEAAQGYIPWFSPANAPDLLSINIENETAFIDLAASLELFRAEDRVCSQQQFMASVEATLGHLQPIEHVYYMIKGDPVVFEDWMRQ